MSEQAEIEEQEGVCFQAGLDNPQRGSHELTGNGACRYAVACIVVFWGYAYKGTASALCALT